MRKTLFQQKSCSPEETFLLGETLGKEARGGDVYLLSGIPGAGKTVFTKGFAKGMGVRALVTSPTYALMNAYNGEKWKLYHFDMYRIADAEEAEETGIFELFSEEDAVIVIEWADHILDRVPARRKELNLAVNEDLTRTVTLEEVDE